MKKSSSIIWGIILVAVGIIFGGNALGLFDIDIFFDGWWTLFIIIPCLIGIFTDSDKTGNIIGLCIGVFLLLCSQEILAFDLLLKLLFPLIIVAIGAKMIFGSFKSGKTKKVMDEVVQQGEAVDDTEDRQADGQAYADGQGDQHPAAGDLAVGD